MRNFSIACPTSAGEGMDIQLKEALSKKPGSTVKVDDIVDDTIVAELEKEGFFDGYISNLTVTRRKPLEGFAVLLSFYLQN